MKLPLQMVRKSKRRKIKKNLKQEEEGIESDLIASKSLK